MIGMVAAQREETRALEARLEGREQAPAGWTTGRLGGRPIALLVTGEGLEMGRRGAERLLATVEVEALVGLGVAGGLTPDLDVGDVLIGERVLSPDGGELVAPDRSTFEADDEALRGTLVTSERIATTADAKRSLAARLELEQLAAVDLESSAWAAAAEAAGRPWVIARAISDPAGEDLPLDFERFRGRDGRISRARLAAYVVTRPHLVPKLNRLRRRVEECAMQLADLVERIVRC